MEDFNYDLRAVKIHNILNPYSCLSWSLESPMSGVYEQWLNRLGHMYEAESCYLIRPKHYDENKAYPLVVFYHDYDIGNGKLYTGVLKDIKGRIVICIGKGILSKGDIDCIHSYYIPMLEREGYKIDLSDVSLFGFFCVKKVTNTDYSRCSSRFKNLVYLREYGFPHLRRFDIIENLVVMKLYWNKMVNKHKEIVDFLNKEL